jgi:hypothetical protein
MVSMAFLASGRSVNHLSSRTRIPGTRMSAPESSGSAFLRAEGFCSPSRVINTAGASSYKARHVRSFGFTPSPHASEVRNAVQVEPRFA